MAEDRSGPQVLVFWGAGATRTLGIRSTDAQGQFIHALAGTSDPTKPLGERVAEALADSNTVQWSAALVDLISILGDTGSSYVSINKISPEQRARMARNWRSGAVQDEIDARIIDLRLTYDWPALKALVRLCPGSKTDHIKLNDLFNLLDMHIPSGFGVRGPTGAMGGDAGRVPDLQFFDARRLVGAKNALLMLLITLFYVDYQVCIASKRDILNQYRDFATLLGYRALRKGLAQAREGALLEHPHFYLSDIGFVSLNYDPILTWVQWIANRDLNNNNAARVGSAPLHLFNDFGHMIPSRSIGRRQSNFPWYPMNEAAAQRLNELNSSDPKILLTKILFPHGCLCWRECPDCGKLSAYHGDNWDLASGSLLPPPPLLAFCNGVPPNRLTDSERRDRDKGIIDARCCLHCGTLNYANHTQVVMQSSFKARPPSFIEEIQRDLQAMTMQADHIIFMGYSLPLDDVYYRAFLSARSRREGKKQVRCTVVNKSSEYAGWYGPGEIENLNLSGIIKPVNAAREIFGAANVRLYGGGIPEVFLDRGVATEARLEKLLKWT